MRDRPWRWVRVVLRPLLGAAAAIALVLAGMTLVESGPDEPGEYVRPPVVTLPWSPGETR